MKRNLLKTVNLFTLLVLLLTLGYTAYVLANLYTEGISDARLEITRMSARANTLLNIEHMEFEENLRLFRSTLADVSNIKSFVLYNENDELIYVYARNPRYLEVAPEAEQFLRSSINLIYNNLIETSHMVELAAEGNLIGEGVYQIFTPASLLSISTNVLYVLAALTLVLLLSLLFLSKGDSSHAYSPESDRQSNAAFGSLGNSTPAYNEYSLHSDIQPSSTTGKNEEESLYAPDSGLCFEQYLEERLSNELRRAAAFDEDLVTALIQCGNAMEDRLTYIQLAQKLKDHFNFHDLLFEVENDKMAVILPNTDLEQGINELSDFQKEVYKYSGEKLCTFDIKIGLSSRNGRLINSDRILKEAHAALRKAEHDIETNLVGFRPDPGKFRSFLASQED